MQAFLHSHQIYLDSDSCVIRQAQVTTLADRTAARLADVVAEASGFLRSGIYQSTSMSGTWYNCQ